jgi:hypothetical protein
MILGIKKEKINRAIEKKTLKEISNLLNKERKPLSAKDSKNPDILQLTFQQKRVLLQQFIDHADDKGIRVFDANNFTLNLYVPLNLFDDLGDKKRENKQGNREKNL